MVAVNIGIELDLICLIVVNIWSGQVYVKQGTRTILKLKLWFVTPLYLDELLMKFEVNISHSTSDIVCTLWWEMKTPTHSRVIVKNHIYHKGKPDLHSTLVISNSLSEWIQDSAYVKLAYLSYLLAKFVMEYRVHNMSRRVLCI